MQALPAAPAAHPVAVRALAHLTTALLVGQSLRPTALRRALLSPSPVPARQRYKRVARAWTRPWLSPAWLSPQLVPAMLALVAPDRDGRRHRALDSVRCGPWEVFTLGGVWHGRVVPVGWAVLPFPWPKGQCTPTVCALVRQVAAAWPAERPVPLVADRGFPSYALFLTLRRVGWGWTLRLRAGSWVTVDGQSHWVRHLLDHANPLTWAVRSASYGGGPHAWPGRLVLGQGLPVVPIHQRGPTSLARRAAQCRRRQHHVAGNHPGRRRPDASVQTAAWVVLFTRQADGQAAWRSYGRRWAAEGSYRDAQAGWDGHHGWDLERVLAGLTDPRRVERGVGLWALGAWVQTWVGHRLSPPAAPGPVPLIRREGTTTGRLSVWARGQLALSEPTGRLRPWLRQILAAGARRVAAGPRRPACQPAPHSARILAAQEAAA
jgi:hypothetical protein